MHGNLGGFVQNYVLYSIKGFALLVSNSLDIIFL